MCFSYVVYCIYLVDSHYCVSSLVPTTYSADAAERAIQFATKAVTQEDEDSLDVEAQAAPLDDSPAASGSSSAAEQLLGHEDSKPASKTEVALDCSDDDEPSVVSCAILCV